VSNKSRGTAFENKIKHLFESWGFFMTRAAGSFGVDLVGFKKGVNPLLINVKLKRVYLGPAERKQLIEDARKYDAIPLVAYRHVEKGKKKGKPCIQIVTEKWKGLEDRALVEAPGNRSLLLGPLEGLNLLPLYIHRE
jgi:Holliday junction resolvase